jgi:glycosyltransferase involved in cell wall biosynthesis
MPAFMHGRKRIRAQQVDLVYSTGGAWSAHLAGLWLKKATGVYWMAEIHDPLVIRSNPDDLGFARPKNRDARLRQWLEAQICKHADLAWWFTDGAVHYAQLRNPHLNQAGNAMAAMVIPGAEPPATAIGNGPANQSNRPAATHAYGKYFTISHFGSLANNRSISTVLHALPAFFNRYPQARGVLRIDVYGAKIDSLTVEAIRQCGFEDIVIEHGRIEKDPVTGQSGRERIAERMQAADVLLLLHGDDEWCSEYIPSKMYEYFWMGRPIWAITHRNPQMNQLLAERHAYISAADDASSIDQTLERLWLDWQQQNLAPLSWQPIGVDQAARKILSLLD